MSAGVGAEPAALVEEWSRWAHGARGTAALRVAGGDRFGARLAEVRGEVRREAVELLLASATSAEAAEEMHRRARARQQRTPPLIGFDQAAVEYTAARTWQACAWALDPELPEVQVRWG